MPTTVTKDMGVLAEGLNRVAIEYGEEWQEPLKKELDLEAILTAENGVVYCENTYSEGEFEMEGTVQQYQGKFTPTGNIHLGSRENKLQRLKSDLEFDEEAMDKFWDSKYPQYEGSVNASFEDNPFLQDFLDEKYINQWKREMRMVAVKGVKTAVTSGTPTTILGSIDGFDKVFNDEITAGNVPTITTGVLTATNILEKVQFALESIDEDLWDEGMNIYMGPKEALWFSRLYKKDHPYAQAMVNDPTAPALFVDDFNAKIHRIYNMRQSGRIWIDCKVNGKSNMIVGKHKFKSDMPTLTFVPQIRSIQAKADWHRFYGLRRFGFTYITKVA